MRSRRRIASKYSGLAVFIVLFSLGAFFYNEKVFEDSTGIRFLQQQEASPVIEKVPVRRAPLIEPSSTRGEVLSTGVIFWDKYDLGCNKRNALNGCLIDNGVEKPTIVLNSVQFVKEHKGLHIFDGVSTEVQLAKEEAVDIDVRGNLVWKVTERSPKYQYCQQPSNAETAAMISLGPISWPTTLNGQQLSTFRATTGDGTVQYAVIDPTGRLFTDFKVEDIINFCDQSDVDRRYALQTIDTFNAKLPGYNQGDPMGYSLLALCNLGAPDGETMSKEGRQAMIEALWKAQDVDVKSVSALIEIENNFSGRIDPKFRDQIKEKGISGVALSGVSYLGMYGFQTSQARQARIPNSTAASKKLLMPFLRPGFNFDEIDVQPPENESSTIISSESTVRQREIWKATVVGAVSGGVYYMDESVASDTENLARLTWNPRNQADDSFFCHVDENNLKRCPVIRAIGGCSSAGFAQTDIRLRQITLAAVNDTQRYASVFNEDGVARTTTRATHLYAQMFQAPGNDLVTRASIDELLVASAKGTPTCTASAIERIEQQRSKLSENDMSRLESELLKLDYTDQAILVTPVRVKYRSWAVYDVDRDLIQECLAWARANTRNTGRLGATKVNNGACRGMDPDNNGFNVDVVEKWNGDEYVVKPALISFNIATYYMGLSNMAPNDVRLANFKIDLQTSLAEQKIYEYPDVYVDCGMNANNELEYWMCRESDVTLLPKCGDTQKE